MKQLFFLLLIIIGLGSSCYGQANTLIFGKIKNYRSQVPYAKFILNERFIDNSVTEHTSTVYQGDSTFAFAIEVRTPQLAVIEYARDIAVIYVEPNDTLFVTLDADDLGNIVGFEGKGAVNNQFWTQFKNKFPEEKNEFLYKNYRYGTYWYSIDPEMDIVMLNKEKEPFISYMQESYEKQVKYFDDFITTNGHELSESFQQFMRGEIDYTWAHSVLVYGTIYRYRYSIEADYFKNLEAITLNADLLGNYKYRQYIEAYMNYMYEWNKVGGDPYAAQYDLAGLNLNGMSSSYLQARLIERGFSKAESVKEIIPKYNDFVQNNEYYEFDNKVIDAYQKAVRIAAGSSAPNFDLLDTSRYLVKLSDFQGKPVYLNFWATWCGPCIRKMKKLQPYMEQLETEGIQFVHISLDREESTWQEYLQQNKITGVHLFASLGVDSKTAIAYNVQALPQYFLIDKAGKLLSKPKKSKVEDLLPFLNKMLVK